jgi:hypothetical protein
MYCAEILVEIHRLPRMANILWNHCKKFQPKYSGPFIVNEILSPTLVKLKDKNTGKLFKNLIHMDRLKIAFVRAPNPTNYFIQEPVVAKRI